MLDVKGDINKNLDPLYLSSEFEFLGYFGSSFTITHKKIFTLKKDDKEKKFVILCVYPSSNNDIENKMYKGPEDINFNYLLDENVVAHNYDIICTSSDPTNISNIENCRNMLLKKKKEAIEELNVKIKQTKQSLNKLLQCVNMNNLLDNLNNERPDYFKQLNT